MRILLVGGSGLVGTKLATYLVNRGHEVICFNRTKPEMVSEQCKYELGDLGEYGLLYQIMKKYKIDTVIHNAAISHPMLFKDNPYKVYRVNVAGTLNVLEAAKLFDVSRFIYISSGAVYGNTDELVVYEEQKLHGESPYGASKVACEEIVRNYGISAVSLRIGFVYGPGRNMECPIQKALYHAISDIPLTMDCGADQKMDYIYVEDCVEAIGAIVESKRLKFDAYNIGGGKLISYRDVLAKVEELYPHARFDIGSGGLGYDNLEAMRIKRMEEDTGWYPRISIQQGIEMYAKWMEKNLKK